jgi:hypothetical protein
MSDRFPDVDWYCDECNEHLNDHPGFTDEHEIWACADCGHENGITVDAILSEEAVARALDFLQTFDPKGYSG